MQNNLVFTENTEKGTRMARTDTKTWKQNSNDTRE